MAYFGSNFNRFNLFNRYPGLRVYYLRSRLRLRSWLCALRLTVYGLRLTVWSAAQAQAWVNMLDLLVHCTTCVIPSCHYVRTDAYVNAVRHALESKQLWAETLLPLERRTKDQNWNQNQSKESIKRRLGMWYKLGKEIGMIYNPPSNATLPGESGVAPVISKVFSTQGIQSFKVFKTFRTLRMPRAGTCLELTSCSD